MVLLSVCLYYSLQVGHGLHPTNESVILQWAVGNGQFSGQVWLFYGFYIHVAVIYFEKLLKKRICLFTQVRHIGFSTGWGSVGEFKIWKKEDSDENHNEAFTLGVPHNIVPGSERATAFMIGTRFLMYACRHVIAVFRKTFSIYYFRYTPSLEL